jgi:hypothetical protein
MTAPSTDTVIERALAHAENHHEAAAVIGALVTELEQWRGMAKALIAERVGANHDDPLHEPVGAGPSTAPRPQDHEAHRAD